MKSGVGLFSECPNQQEGEKSGPVNKSAQSGQRFTSHVWTAGGSVKP